MTSAAILNADDLCHRRGAFEREGWQQNILNPTAALYRAIEAGLLHDGPDAGQFASDTLMDLAVDRGLDTKQDDLLGHAQHLAGIADFVTWLLRPEKPWERPEATKIGEEPWRPSAFLSARGDRLRRLVLVDHWSEARAKAEERDWRSLGETAAYGVPMDPVVIVLGQNRDGRRHGAITKAWTHPVNKVLRFRKRDGAGFDGAWKPTWREQAKFSREEWLEAMTEDGVLVDTVLTHEVLVPHNLAEVRTLMERSLVRIGSQGKTPDPQFSRCFNPINVCPFRWCCADFQEPSEETGFVQIR